MSTQPIPQVRQPIPQVRQPIPQVRQPSSQVGKPSPQVRQPIPQVRQPIPQSGRPSSQVRQPIPQVRQPSPQVGKPSPQVGRPSSQVGKPSPQVGKPSPQLTKPPTSKDSKSETNSKSSNNNNNDNDNDNNNDNSRKKSKKTGKDGKFTRMGKALLKPSEMLTNKVGKTYKGLKENLKKQTLSDSKFYREDDKGLMGVEKYQKRLIKEEQNLKELSTSEGIIYGKNGDVIYPALELDAFLNARRKIKQEEFKKLQQTEGFYFSKGLTSKELQESKLNEGGYLIGTNINALLDLFGISLKEQGLDNIKGDVLSKGKSFELIGEYVDASNKMDSILKDKMGFRLDDTRSLMPEKELTEFSSFDNILKESAKYNMNNKIKLTPKSMYIMIKILHKYKKTTPQWLRSATALEIIYSYLSNGLLREDFFKLTTKINIEGINELDEFYKTEHLFMTLPELQLYKRKLNFYKYDMEKDTFLST